MASIIDNIKAGFARGTLLVRLIYLNVAVFLLVHLVAVILTLWNIHPTAWMAYIDLPSDIGELLHRPWTLLTYMYVHYDVWHILFNMLWFYWFGNIFLQYFTPKQMGGLYLLGGLAGALFYVAAYNIFPYFWPMTDYSFLLGASASVLGIVTATAYREPNYPIRLLFIGTIRLKYLALIVIGLDVLAITAENAGGHIAHLGGALAGLWFAASLSKGADLTRWINRATDWVTGVFRPRPRKPKMKIHYGANTDRQKDYDYNARKKAQNDEIDRILDKVRKSGYHGLTEEEKKFT